VLQKALALTLALGGDGGALSARHERIRRGGEGEWRNTANLEFAQCAADIENRLTSPPPV
jgi:hypothetical protein